MNKTKSALQVTSTESFVIARITRHLLRMNVNVPFVEPSDRTITIQVFFDRTNGAGENNDSIFQIILGDEALADTPLNQIIHQPVTNDAGDAFESFGELLNEALGDWLQALAKPDRPIIHGDEWEGWFDDLLAEIEKQTGVKNAF